MSTIYSDAAGNKYLGDCRWGNHDINYSSTSFLKSVDGYSKAEMLTDFSSILTSSGYTNISVALNWPASNPSNIFTFSLPGNTTPSFQVYTSQFNSSGDNWTTGIVRYLSTPLVDFFGGSAVDYAMCCGSQSFGFLNFRYSAPYTFPISNSTEFIYMGKLLDVNPNFNYYSTYIRQLVYIRNNRNNSLSTSGLNRHWINSAEDLLTTGRAVYSISCSDGQTPNSQWATDMWVYDNNSTLGDPVIGRVQNLLLGVGSYTYLKPVKIQGSAFPDNGSPWYLPVKTFAGKTLLMRCYSSMT